MTTSTDPTALTSRFSYQSPTHSFTLHWTSLGSPSSPPIIFIHGTPWSSRVWVPFALSLATKYHVHLFDNPGFGDSPIQQPLANPSQEITDAICLDADLSQQSAAFAALFHHWQNDPKQGWAGRKPQVIAHDHAGLMALRAHLLHGCEYASLCLIDVVAIGPFGQPLFKHVAAHREVFEQLTGAVFEGVVESYIRDAAHKELSKETMEMLKRPWLRDEEARKGFVRQMCQANSRSTEEVEGWYGEVGKRMPVKIVWGKEDMWIKCETAERLGDALGATEVVIVEGGGHLIMYDEPARLGVELGLWLGSVEQ